MSWAATNDTKQRRFHQLLPDRFREYGGSDADIGNDKLNFMWWE